MLASILVSYSVHAIVGLMIGCTANSDSVEPPEVSAKTARIVYVIPANASPKPDYQARLESFATRTEKFISNWMTYWERPIEREQFFARDSNGDVQITLVKVSLQGGPKGRNSIGPLRKLAIDSASKKLKLKKNARVVWWIFYDYPGVIGFRGGGNSFWGGTAINAYPGGKGPIDQNADLASPKVNGTQIKGSIHELGHALGLPHNGPRMELKLGNSLMGATTPKFAKRVNSKEFRVYLNDASSALIWKHPLFRNGGSKPELPKRLQIKNLDVTEEKNGKITVSGVLDSNLTAHSAVVFNTSRDKVGDYWGRSHTGKVDEDGKFAVSLWSPHTKGNLFLAFCFHNGTNTADSKKRKSFLKIAYTGKTGQRKFKLPSK